MAAEADYVGFELNRQKTEKPMSLNICCSCASQLVTKNPPDRVLMVGCTKDPVGRGKRLIIVDCITEDGPVPGALWTFSAQTTSKKVKKYDFPPVESAVADEKAWEMQKIKKQNDHMEENLQASTSTKNKRKEKSSHQLFINKVKKMMRWRSEMKNMKKKLVF